ncbi:response regulator [Pseudoxanthomonas putridarboris]|uniref:Response regulator n=1 Tax=Pseudoxanthomonas putridarboris TaxID=752605 RepID=A0ABU9J101_9GAMM
MEDDALLRSVTSMALEDAGYEVTEAVNGVDARSKLTGARFDYVVSDISMPSGVSGIDISQTVRDSSPDTITVLVSGYARSQLPPIPPGTRFLKKPYRVKDLLDALSTDE